MARILVADDDSGVRHFLRRILEAGNHQVWEASDGDQATHMAITQSFDLVIADLAMCCTRGLQAAREILREKPEQKMIFMSGIVSPTIAELRKTTEENGVRCFLTKPIRGDEVVDAVTRALCR